MLDHSCQVQGHTYAEQENGCCSTPPVAVEALLRVERLPHKIWEPAASRGAIVRTLRDRGHAVCGEAASPLERALDLVAGGAA